MAIKFDSRDDNWQVRVLGKVGLSVDSGIYGCNLSVVWWVQFCHCFRLSMIRKRFKFGSSALIPYQQFLRMKNYE
jgi:hypothetical protein